MHSSHLSALFALVMTLLAACKDEPCGNGSIDANEECDGADLGGLTCANTGFSYGDLGCSTKCKLDTTACVSDPCWTYPCEEPGTEIGSVIPNMWFEPGPDLGAALAGADGALGLDDLYMANPAHGGMLKGLLLFISAEWCPYCSQEASVLNELYEEYAGRGIMILGVLLENERGDPAGLDDAQEYSERNNWSFPSVAGSLAPALWASRANEGSFPLNLIVDLTNMRLSGRLEGLATNKVLRRAFDELAVGIAWGEDGVRPMSFDCAPGTGTEIEPNGLGDPSTAVSSLPFTLTGTICPPIVAEGVVRDEDLLDLGELAAGTVLSVTMSRHEASHNYPFFFFARLAEQEMTWLQYSPLRLDGEPSSRQLAVSESGHYVLAAEDGRLASWLYYGEADPPEEDDCCEGGPDYTYSLTADYGTLAATELPLVVGTSTTHSLEIDAFKVHPLSATASTTYSIEMRALDPSILDPQLFLYDAATTTLLAFNDDIDFDLGNWDARINWTATADATLWVVASYNLAVVHNQAISYALDVD